jgi:hypothetical protein
VNYYISGAGNTTDNKYPHLGSFPAHHVPVRYPGPSATFLHGGFLQVEVWNVDMNVTFWRSDGVLIHTEHQLLPGSVPPVIQTPQMVVPPGVVTCRFSTFTGICRKISDPCDGTVVAAAACANVSNSTAQCCLPNPAPPPPATAPVVVNPPPPLPPTPILSGPPGSVLTCTFGSHVGVCKRVSEPCPGGAIDTFTCPSIGGPTTCCLNSPPTPGVVPPTTKAPQAPQPPIPPTNPVNPVSKSPSPKGPSTPGWVLAVIVAGIVVLVLVSVILIYFLLAKRPSKRSGDGYALI